MAGRGPSPKHPNQRTRSGSGTQNLAFRTLELPTNEMLPEEPPTDLLGDGEVWHPATLRWWGRWRRSPLTWNLPEPDVSELEACAVLYQEFVLTRKKDVAAEYRQRIASFGATPADRMRLRILTADADTKEEKRPAAKPAASAEQKYGHLRAVKKTG